MIRQATLSPCGLYRYELVRSWRSDLPLLSWCMLNPSKADAEIDDQTIRKCCGFARARRVDVGVDCFGLAPIQMAMAIEIARAKPGEWADHHRPPDPP